MGAASVLVIGAGLPATAAAGPVPDAAPPQWEQVKLPSGNAVLSGTVKPDARTTWAAGFRVPQDDGGLSPVLYTHDDRSSGPWKEMSTASDFTGRINALAATSARDAWLVGDVAWEGEPVMAQHWDGRSWRVKPAPMPANTLGGGLLGVAAVSASNVWAAGWSQVLDKRIPDPDGGTEIVDHNEGLVQHWDGHAWKPSKLPQPYANWGLNAISASGPKDVWAVGSGYGDDDQPVVLHFDGRSWTAMPTPPYGGVYGEFNDVVAKGPRDVWVVGRTLLDDKDRGHALIVHWDGHKWTRMDAPGDAGGLSGVAATRAGIVAVGRAANDDGGYALRASGTRVTSLGFPANADGMSDSPWKISVTGGVVSISGSARYVSEQGPQPLLLTTRL